MPSRNDIDTLTVEALVCLARDRFRMLGACLHWDWAPVRPHESADLFQDHHPIDGVSLAEELTELAGVMEARGRLIDAACCWGLVGSFFSKFNHYDLPPSPIDPDSGYGWPEDVIESLRRWWAFTDPGRAVTPFGRAGLAFLRAHDEHGEEAERAILHRCMGTRTYRQALRNLKGFIGLAAKQTGRLPADYLWEESGQVAMDRVLEESFYRLQPLWCARGILHGLDQPGVPPPEGSALKFLQALDQRWDEWFALFLELEKVFLLVHTPSYDEEDDGKPLDHDRRRLVAACDAARRT